MTRGRTGVIRQLQSLYDSGTIGRLSDAELLDRFSPRHGDASEVAFTTIVERHGPMVLGVCGRILRDSHRAQDAFQATFLVLARRADSLRLEGSLGPWLHGVAVRVARRTRVSALRYESREISLSIDVESGEDIDPDQFELRAVLDQELDGLPANYRAALVLCHLEGLSHEQAARQLGWPVGTLRSRLARGRDRLRGRLLRRGLAPTMVALSTLTESSAATIDAGLAHATIRSALRRIQVGTAHDAIPAVVASLTEEVLKTMFTAKMRMATVALLAAGLLATGAAVVAGIGAAGKDAGSPAPGQHIPRSSPGRLQINRPAAEILAEIDAIYQQHGWANKEPGRRAKILEDPVAFREYQEDQRRAVTHRNHLVWEMYRAYPDHERVPTLLKSRWMNKQQVVDPKAAEQTLAEINQVLAECQNPRLAIDVAFLRAEFILRKNLAGPGATVFEATMPAIEEAIRRAPRDLRGAGLLMALLQQLQLSPETRERLSNRILDDYPDSTVGKMILKGRRTQAQVGKPIDLEFTDAMRGTKVSMKALRGKVVVIDFWSVGCGPCVAEMPKMNARYATYRDRGVEFIGVNTDAAVGKDGLDRIKAFVEKNRIDWPQYFQGGSGEGSFSDTWGVYLLPTVFVVDREGNLASIDARGKLDQLILKLLESKHEITKN